VYTTKVGCGDLAEIAAPGAVRSEVPGRPPRTNRFRRPGLIRDTMRAQTDQAALRNAGQSMRASAQVAPVDPEAKDSPFACATCAKASCFRGELERMPATCPTRTRPELARDPRPYLDPSVHAEMVAADATPFASDGALRNRVEELVAYAEAQGFRRIGIAYCVTLAKEAQRLGRLLRAAGLHAELVCCRVGAVDYDEIGLPKQHPERFAAICNPVAQARLLDARGVDLVAQVGLCIGHDVILQRESKAPVTTLVVKDRALDHHSVMALR
jgi:uncharacterized metal-binding protein